MRADPDYHLEIDEKSSRPKYKQIVQSVVDNIELGHLKMGDRLPSINELSIRYYLSRDTVEKAYNELKEKGILEAVKGKGFYVMNAAPGSKLRVLLLFNKISSYKKVIYHQMADCLGEKARLDLFIYHYNFDLFQTIIQENLGKYNFYVIMPHFAEYDTYYTAIVKTIKRINPQKLIILDNLLEGIDEYKGAVYQDFKMDIYEAMYQGMKHLEKYQQLVLVIPMNPSYPYPKHITDGFRRFCTLHSFSFEILHTIPSDRVLTPGTTYVVVEENDLALLIKMIRDQQLKIGHDIGILSYNDTTLKEVLADGISVMTTDFEAMGKLTCDLILNRADGPIKNDFRLIMRKTL